MKIYHVYVRLHNATMRVLGFLLPPWNIGWKAKLLIFGGSGTVIVLVTMLVTVWLAPVPEPSGDTIEEQVDRASEVCSLGLRTTDRSDCSVEAWKACHIAQQYLDEGNGDPKIEHADGAMYICDLAVLADAGELASVLADRYGEGIERRGRYVRGSEILINIPRDRKKSGDNLRDGEGFHEFYIVPNESFILFEDLGDSEFLLLDELNDFSDTPESIDSEYHVDDIKPLPALINNRVIDNRERYPLYSTLSAETIDLLSNFASAVENYFGYKILARGYRPDGTPVVGESPWQQTSISEVPDSVKQICANARKSIRERASDTQESLDNCLRAAETCADVAPGSSTACSLAIGAVEFENSWQQLPEICSRTNRPDETEIDECRLAATEICQYQLVSSQDYWIGQLILMRDFACATAGKLPKSQSFCSDNPRNYLCDPDLTDILEHQKGGSPYLVAFDDSALTEAGRTTLIDVLNNDIYAIRDTARTHNQYPRINVHVLPEIGNTRIIAPDYYYPTIEYTPYMSGRDTLSYTICDVFEKCDEAQVKITVLGTDCSITGTQKKDVLTGTSSDDVICGLRGDDIIDGRGGNDIIIGGDGDDMLRGNQGNDIIYPGPGNNIVILDEAEKDKIIPEADDNTVTYTHPDDDG